MTACLSCLADLFAMPTWQPDCLILVWQLFVHTLCVWLPHTSPWRWPPSRPSLTVSLTYPSTCPHDTLIYRHSYIHTHNHACTNMIFTCNRLHYPYETNYMIRRVSIITTETLGFLWGPYICVGFWQQVVLIWVDFVSTSIRLELFDGLQSIVVLCDY